MVTSKDYESLLCEVTDPQNYVQRFSVRPQAAGEERKTGEKMIN